MANTPKDGADRSVGVSRIVGGVKKLGAAAKSAASVVQKEAPKTYQYLSFKARQANHQLVQPVVEPAKKALAKAVHRVVDASEAAASRRLASESAKKVKTDFRSAAHKPASILRKQSVALSRSGAGGEEARINVKFSGMQSSAQNTSAPTRRKR